jgi:hypothetical protein
MLCSQRIARRYILEDRTLCKKLAKAVILNLLHLVSHQAFFFKSVATVKYNAPKDYNFKINVYVNIMLIMNKSFYFRGRTSHPANRELPPNENRRARSLLSA